MVGAKQHKRTADAVIGVFEQGVHLLDAISDAVFAGYDPTNSIGAHFRHNLEFAIQFLAGFEAGEIDYASRVRDVRVATDRSYAIGRMRQVIEALGAISDMPSREIRIVSEVDRESRLVSSVGRELEFLMSHTIHHYALISFKLRAIGIEVPDGFGVAPSTIRYWKDERKENAG